MVVGPVSGGKYIALRVIATAIPICFAMGLTAAVFLAVPTVNDALNLAIGAGGAMFMLLVIAPAFAIAAVTTVLAIRILWNASEPQNTDQKSDSRSSPG